ncbi:hypothetical protein ACFP3T_05705 [Lactiplantibacillus dongliensis]|uniref:DUF4352 domain-containing protein n=1 Tax=Lactiplantibacillus dongliensis TaxID=2559919 RepID=A0ABW1R2T0_9LACO|nr:hypothetical protein [Lactiplantibacillus dongliensis]
MKLRSKIVLLMTPGLLGVGFVVRYRMVNRNYHRQTVKEVIVKQGELVKDKTVHFKILSAETKLTATEAFASVRISVNQIGPGNYGFKHDYPYYDENMWFNIPYGYYSVAKGAEKPHGGLLNMAEMERPGTRMIVMNFRTPIDNYRGRNGTSRFSFLVPQDSNRFIKYSYLLNFES